MRATGRLTTARGGDDGLIELELDDEPWCRVEPEVVAELGLLVGDIVPASTRRRVERAARDRTAVERAAGMLSRRAYARADLERRLARGAGEVSARRAVERLDALGVLDDRRYADDLAETRLRAGWGPLRIRHDLEQAGVDRTIVDAVLATIDADRWAAAERVACGTRTGQAALRRLIGRGFDPELIADRFADDVEGP